MKVAVSEFKAKCTKFFRTVEEEHETIEITRRGKLIAFVQPVTTSRPDPSEFLDCLQGTVTVTADWDAPLGDEDWDACK